MNSKLDDSELSKKNVIMFGGKGGVGKTTCSAATALHFARKGEKTLIISSDPAPSLSDIFEVEIGDKGKKIVKNLYGIEISSDEVLKKWKEKYGEEMYEVLSSFIPIKYEFIDYIGETPGVVGNFMLDYIMDLVKKSEYDILIWDTAPTGDTIRLMNMPVTLARHLKEAAKVYMGLYGYMTQLRDSIGLKKSKHSIFDIIEGWKETSIRISEFIKDPSRTEFIVVTIPEALGVYQTERLVKYLNGIGVSINNIIVNNVIKNPDCEFHRRRIMTQKPYLGRLTQGFNNIIALPQFPYEIKGIERLSKVEKILF